MDCPSCGHANPKGSKFCNECATRLTSPRDSERRQLTVMFVDLVGSTALSERVDAEDLAVILDGYQTACRRALEPWDGYVAQPLGDGLLIYFGYPRAQEDAPVRAVRAALDIVAAMDPLNDALVDEYAALGEHRLEVRVGIHTGPVVVGESLAAAGDRLAVGDTLNIAARLQGVAGPDEVVVSETTHRLVAGLFLTTGLGTPTLRGVTEPIGAHRVIRATGVRSRLDADPARLTPLVGRDHEVSVLLDRWRRVQAGDGQVVLVGGEAGVGKSRLLRALRDGLAPDRHTWIECQSTAFSQGSAFSPLVELIHRGLSLEPQGEPEQTLRRLERAMDHAGLDVLESVALIGPLLSLPLPDRYPRLDLSPEYRREKTIETLVAWALGVAQDQPLVVAVEDLHWADPSTLDFLDGLVEACGTAELLLLATARPEFSARWSRAPHFTHLEVSRLPRGHAEELIGQAAGERTLAPELVAGIVERAEGVPLFLEELTRTVLEAPREAHEIPATLQDSLMARLDRLGSAKEVAQAGSVLGRQFTRATVAAIAPLDGPLLAEGLERLVEAEILFERGSPPDPTYVFRHALIQDTAYESLLRRRRRELHARAAEALVERFPERAKAEPEVVARHYDEAGLGANAIEYYEAASRRAIRQTANEEAIRLLRRSIEILATLPASEERDRIELKLLLAIGVPLAAARGWPDPENKRSIERARELVGRGVGTPHVQFHFWMGLFVRQLVTGEIDDAGHSATSALAIADQLDDYEVVTGAAGLGQVLYYQGRFEEALVQLERAASLYDPETHGPIAFRRGVDMGNYTGVYLAQSYWPLGYAERAIRVGQETIETAERVGHPFSLATAYLFQSIAWMRLRGDPEEVKRLARRARDICEESGFAVWLMLARMMGASAWVDTDEAQAVCGELTSQIQHYEDAGFRTGLPECLGILARTNLALGRYDEAARAIDRARHWARTTGQGVWDAELERLEGEITVAAGGKPEAAAAAFDRATAIAGRQRAKSFELRAAMSAARLLRHEGREAEARARLAPVHQWFRGGLVTRDLEDAQELLATLG